MMRPAIVLLPALGLLAFPAAAQESKKATPAAPSSEQPAIANGGVSPGITVVDGARDGKLQVRKTYSKAIPETYTVQETVPETVDGKTVNKTVAKQMTRMKFVTESQIENYALSEVRVFDTDGRPVARERIAGLFASPRMVLTTMIGMAVDPAYLKIVRPGTYLVVLPTPQVPMKTNPMRAATGVPMAPSTPGTNNSNAPAAPAAPTAPSRALTPPSTPPA